jgi:hypothetical protein
MLILLCAVMIGSAAQAQNKLPSQAEMWQIIQKQSKQIDAMQKQINALTAHSETTDEQDPYRRLRRNALQQPRR